MLRTVRAGGAAIGAALLTVLLTGVPARADAERTSQWYFAPMQLAKAQTLGNGGEGVTVAVLDTGIDTTHQDLRGATLPGYNTVRKGPSDSLDNGGHGTGIATLIAGRGHGSGDGLLGVAPRSKVMAVTPSDDPVYAAEGIRWAVAHGAKVINMSFALSVGGDVMQKAVDEAVAADVVLVAGSGNEHQAVGLPAGLRGVLAVGAVDRNNKVADFSNYGKELDLVAYGTQIPAARPNNTYTVVKGTSDSTALVSGVAALIRARYPDMSAAEVVDRLTRTATDRGAKGRDDYYGYGQLNPVAALTAPRVAPSATTAVPTDAPVTAAQGPAPVTSAVDGGLPGWLFFAAVGGFVLIVTLAVVMIVRVRRGS
ncbi:S8 family serine peptidase [Actinoplanes sp. KI2]|uniref:S8 family serine peptidase n=1 Tax=Actinoplanes sp. KI2 TaxID=2983315 RepID=UPI0021D59B03|nr:S8 family serine peptidase [Actinoplanes sp. KI2]MCU7730627.1 S8 family serine peptidase [Actinoplanes sp. KI2]